MKKFLTFYNLSIVLLISFLLTWLGQYLTHEEGMMKFWNVTFENWQSELFFGLYFVVLTAYLIHKGSPQSKDGDDEMKKDIKEIKQDIKLLKKMER